MKIKKLKRVTILFLSIIILMIICCAIMNTTSYIEINKRSRNPT